MKKIKYKHNGMKTNKNASARVRALLSLHETSKLLLVTPVTNAPMIQQYTHNRRGAYGTSGRSYPLFLHLSRALSLLLTSASSFRYQNRKLAISSFSQALRISSVASWDSPSINPQEVLLLLRRRWYRELPRDGDKPCLCCATYKNI